MISYNVKIKDNSAGWIHKKERELEKGLNTMAKAILARAQVKVPLKGGALKASGKVTGKSLERTVSFGSGLKYGAYQERGERLDGSHKVRRYTTPGTSKHYLKDSGDAVVKEGIKKYL